MAKMDELRYLIFDWLKNQLKTIQSFVFSYLEFSRCVHSDISMEVIEKQKIKVILKIRTTCCIFLPCFVLWHQARVAHAV